MELADPSAGLTFGKLLRDHRVSAGLSQEELAERARMSANGISALERGIRRSPQKETIALLVDALRLTGSDVSRFTAAARGEIGRVLQFPGADARRETQAGNLPSSLNPFFGRESEIAEIAALVEAHRFVTLVGSGGIGKTRTSIEVAARLSDAYPDGVWFVELASVSQGANVLSTVATVLNIEFAGGTVDAVDIVRRLADKTALVVLDNCEHVVQDAASLVSAILRGCANIAILASSRQPLDLAGERTYRLPSLPVPIATNESYLTTREAAQYPAIALFVDRAQAADSRFALTPENASAVAAVCSRLDGIALAIELAATRTKVFTMSQLTRKLDDSLRFLTGTNRGAIPRQQTLRAAIDWSYHLLEERERSLFRRLGIFARGFSIEGVIAIGNETGSDEIDTLDTLASLVDKSLVIADFGSTTARYRLLESTRAFALEKLDACDEREETARRHLDYFLKFFTDLDEQADTTGMAVEEALASDLQEVRAALGFALDSCSDAGAKLLAVIRSYPWYALNLREEMRSHLEIHLKLTDSTPSRERILLNLFLAGYNSNSRSFEEVKRFADEAISAARLCDDEILAEALMRYAWLMADIDIVEADAALQEAMTLPARSGRSAGTFLDTRMVVLLGQGKYAQVVDELQRCVHVTVPTAGMLSHSLRYRLAQGYIGLRDSRKAIELITDLFTNTETDRHWFGRGELLSELAGNYVLLGQYDAALDATRESLAFSLSTSHLLLNGYSLEIAALFLAMSGQSDRAAIIADYADRVIVRSHYTRSLAHQEIYDRLHAHLTPEETSHPSQERGGQPTAEDVTSLALEGLSSYCTHPFLTRDVTPHDPEIDHA